MSDVFNEVDEELRREQANRIFRKFLPLMIAISVIVVGGVAGYQFWTWWDVKQKSEAAEAYQAASALFADEKWDQAKVAFEAFSETGPEGYAALSKMQAGAASMRAGDAAQAAGLFQQASELFEDPLFSDLAMLKATFAVSDQLSLADIDAKLGALAGAGRPYRALARELMAAKAMEEGDLQRARDEFTLLSLSLDAPSGTQQRSQIALSLLGPAPEPALSEPEAASQGAPVADEPDQSIAEEPRP